jgi:SAM-dependent methyltransferase
MSSFLFVAHSACGRASHRDILPGMGIRDILRRLAASPQSQLHGFADTAGEAAIGSMSPDELAAWENADAPSIARASDIAESQTDEKQDLTGSLNFPLHWTSMRESWDFLFDAAIACDLLAPRPDDRVLDFAAGTGWATELLTRVGVRTVSIDLSLEMMRRARQRLASDRRLVFADQASFVAARGQALPFSDESFDGVLCLNALHHLPSYAAALREIHRVLKNGGRAAFSEPGTAHAVEPLSAFRMREHAVLEKRVSLRLVRRLAFDVGFSRMRVVPLRAIASCAFDYSGSPEDEAHLDRVWRDTLRFGPREHSRFVLYKGDEPPADTLLPANQLAGRLRARIDLHHTTPTSRAGSPFSDRLRIVNEGSVTWKARGRRFGGQVTCGLKVMTPGGDVLREDLGRTPLPADVLPGAAIEIDVTVPGAVEPGEYRLRYDMVVEGVTWFDFQGSPCAERALRVVR